MRSSLPRASRLALSILAATFLFACSNETTVFEAPAPDARVPDWEVLRGKYFVLKDPDTAPQVQYLEVRVYLDDRTASNDVELGAEPAEAWADADRKSPQEPYRGSFHLLVEPDDYVLVNFLDPVPSPGLILSEPLRPTEALAVAFEAVIEGDTVSVGIDPAPGDTLELQIVHLPEDRWDTQDLTQSDWAPVAALEQKHIYDLGLRDIDPGALSIRIVRDVAGAGGDNRPTLTNEFGVETPLIEILGLDQKNNADPTDGDPDGFVDPEFIDYENGILVFPDFRPFDPSLADISGTDRRPRSWPRAFLKTRPDTLGWSLDTGTGEAVPSSPFIRSVETVPEIYDLVPSVLQAQSADHSVYAIEVFLDSGN